MSFTFKHPKYYTELRKRNKLDQAISPEAHDGERGRAPKQQASSGTGPGAKLQASSNKPQASSTKLVQVPDASVKPQAQRVKRQATSVKLLDH